MHGMQPSSLQDPHQFYLDNSTIINTIILSITKTTTVSITMTVKNDRNNSNLGIKQKQNINNLQFHRHALHATGQSAKAKPVL